jgi:hypothetical protein
MKPAPAIARELQRRSNWTPAQVIRIVARLGKVAAG